MRSHSKGSAIAGTAALAAGGAKVGLCLDCQRSRSDRCSYVIRIELRVVVKFLV